MKKAISLILVLLMISLPLGTAQQFKEPTKEPVFKEGGRPNASVDAGGDINVEYIGPQTKEEFDLDRNLTLSGRDTFASDFLINVNRYEPLILTASLVETADTPVYAFISGTPITDLGNLPAIRSMSIDVVGGDVKYVARTPKYNPPTVFSGNDLGYVETWIKRIPKEEDVPNRVDLTLLARINFEGEITAPVLGGKIVKILKEDKGTDIFEDGGFIDPELEIFSGRGYVRAINIGDGSATFVVYGQDGVLIDTVSAGVGQETSAVNLVPQTNFDEDKIRIRVERIIRGDKNSAEVKIRHIS